jgi:hypothetical protein
MGWGVISTPSRAWLLIIGPSGLCLLAFRAFITMNFRNPMMRLPKFDYPVPRTVAEAAKIMARSRAGGPEKAMKIRITYTRHLAVFVLSIGLIALSFVASPALVTAQDKIEEVTFKVPEGYMKVPITDFRGVLMLNPEKPAGMFVIYPNDNETSEALRQRILAFIGPMFMHPEKGKSETTITWDTRALPSHEGDGTGKAAANISSGPTQETQIAIYERTTGRIPLLYGYFAMRHKSGKGEDGKFLDEQGQGVKAFDKLWKSFPK